MKKYEYIIGSGWYSQEKEKYEKGKYICRSPEFHKLWYEAINRFTDPCKIFISDSDSPIKPLYDINDKRLEWVEFCRNYHEKYRGWLRGALFGLAYAWINDIDYYVYIEQDALIYGEGIIEHAIENMTKPCIFGSAEKVPWDLQQSFFIIEKSFQFEFLKRVGETSPHFPNGDNTSPEWRFYAAKEGSDWFDYLPFGYGRERPINFDDEYFYFQHGDKEEIERYSRKLNYKFEEVL